MVGDDQNNRNRQSFSSDSNEVNPVSPTLIVQQMQPVPKTQPVQAPPSSPKPKHKHTFLKVLLVLIVLILAAVTTIFILDKRNYGYTITEETLPNIDFGTLVNRTNTSYVQVKKITYKNKFITPRKITIPYVSSCMVKDGFSKDRIKLDTLMSKIYENVNSDPVSVTEGSGDEFTIKPFSKLELTLFVKGDWYNFLYRYLPFKHLDILAFDQKPATDECSDDNYVQKDDITITNNHCFGCIKTVDGADLAIIDYIANDDKVSYDSFITYIPIIQNIGDQYSGPFTVEYGFNGNSQVSFEQKGLAPGEIVDPLIAANGFGGNFQPNMVTPVINEYVLVKPKNNDDLDLSNNKLVMGYRYSSTPVAKHTCTFTDNNKGSGDYYSKSSINYEGRSYEDFCLNNDDLIEFLCDDHPAHKGDQSFNVSLYRCASGCGDGQCLIPAPSGDNELFMPNYVE